MPATELSPREKFLAKPPVVVIGGQGVHVSRAHEIHKAIKAFGPEVGGAVSLTGISNIVASQLRLGEYDQVGASLDAFPDPNLSKRVERNFGRNGKYKVPPKPGNLVHGGTERERHDLNELFIFAAFSEVFQAKNGQNGDEPVNGFVGGNVLDKIPFNQALILGLLVAKGDYIAAGAGIPLWLPGAIDDFTAGQESTYWVYMKGYDQAGKKDRYPLKLDPSEYLPRGVLDGLQRPAILPIFSSTSLMKRYGEMFDGFIYEGRLAGGHLGPEGRNGIVLEEARISTKPFYLAGNWSHRLSEALASGATGVQIGSVTAISQESGYPEEYKLKMVAGIHDGTLRVSTSTEASPTGYEFNIVEFGENDDTTANPDVLKRRIKMCSEGFLVDFKVNSRGDTVEFCAAEPIDTLAIKLELITPNMSKGDKQVVLGELGEKYSKTQCLCNVLESAAGYPTNGAMRNEEGKPVKGPEPKLFTWGRGPVVDPAAREQVLRLTPDPTRLPTIVEVIGDVLSH